MTSRLKEDRICEGCGWLFKPRPNQLFCAYSCWLKSKQSRLLRECRRCGKTFRVDYHASTHIYCSLTCKGAASKKPLPTLTCQQCNRAFIPKRRDMCDQRFCSVDCHNEAQRGISKYPGALKTRLCVSCNKEFLSRKSALYCSECKKDRARNASSSHHSKMKAAYQILEQLGVKL